MRRLRRIQVLDSELPSGQISYQTKLRKCFDSEYRLVCEELSCQVVELLSVDAKTLRLVLLFDRLGISKVLVPTWIGLPFKNKPPLPLVALFDVGGTPAFEILTV
jgi:hypothetical protein